MSKKLFIDKNKKAVLVPCNFTYRDCSNVLHHALYKLKNNAKIVVLNVNKKGRGYAREQLKAFILKASLANNFEIEFSAKNGYYTMPSKKKPKKFLLHSLLWARTE